LRLTLTRTSEDPASQSVFGVVLADGFRAYSCEREWRNNEPGHSCVPPGFYHLVPHRGNKYPNSFALIGHTVSHYPEPGIMRNVCVIHWASQGKYLQGCISTGQVIAEVAEGGARRLVGKGGLAAWLQTQDPPHYLTILDRVVPSLEVDVDVTEDA